MKENRITIRQSILITKPREIVWDYTQNYNYRPMWDSSVLETTILQTIPHKIVKLKLIGNTTITFAYKLEQRPYKTTLAIKDIKSPLIANGGGYWTYEEQEGATLWTQINTIIFKETLILKFLLPVLKFTFALLTKKAMKNAKQEIEKL